MTDFKDARCRQFEEATCGRGGYCNFMHLKKVSSKLQRRLLAASRRDDDRYDDRRRDDRYDDRRRYDDYRRDDYPPPSEPRAARPPVHARAVATSRLP